MKSIFYIFLAFFFVGCATQSIDYNVTKVSFYTPSWYKNFDQKELDNLINLGLKNNEDIQTAALNLRQAILRSKISKADLYPTMAAKLNANTSRDIGTSSDFKDQYRNEFSLSYELDIYGKIYDEYKSASWNATLSRLNLDSLRLTIINQISDLYFNILYLNDSIRNLENNLQNSLELNKIVLAKYNFGKEEMLSLRQSRQNILEIKNQILQDKRELTTKYEILKNLTRSDKTLDKLSLNDISSTDNVSLEIKFDTIKHRPDINEAIARLNSSFYDHKVSQKRLYPTISIGASLSDSDEKFKDSFGFDTLGGNLSISLPFLDYARLEKNIQISKFEFDKNVLNYEKSLSNATNEIIKYVNLYRSDKDKYENMLKINEEKRAIVGIYNSKYIFGKVELKDLIEAKNSLLSTEISLLNQKYRLLNDEISYYKAIAK